MHSEFRDEKYMLGGQTMRDQEYSWIIILVALQDQQRDMNQHCQFIKGKIFEKIIQREFVIKRG